MTDLIAAARVGDNNSIKCILPNEVGTLGPDGLSALHTAILGAHEECCFLLAPYEALLHTREGVSPLILAIRAGNVNLVELFLEFYDISRITGPLSPLDEAVLHGHVHILERLLNYEFTLEQALGALWTAHKINQFEDVYEVIYQAVIFNRSRDTRAQESDKAAPIGSGELAASVSASIRAISKSNVVSSKMAESQQETNNISSADKNSKEYLYQSRSQCQQLPVEVPSDTDTITEEGLQNMPKHSLISLCMQLQEKLNITTMEANHLEQILTEMNNGDTNIANTSHTSHMTLSSISSVPKARTLDTDLTTSVLSRKGDAEVVPLEAYQNLQNSMREVQKSLNSTKQRMAEVEAAYAQEKRVSNELREKVMSTPAQHMVVQRHSTGSQEPYTQVALLRKSTSAKSSSASARHGEPSVVSQGKDPEVERLRMEIISRNTEVLDLQSQIHRLERMSFGPNGYGRDSSVIMDARERLERAKRRSRIAQMQLDKLQLTNAKQMPGNDM